MWGTPSNNIPWEFLLVEAKQERITGPIIVLYHCLCSLPEWVDHSGPLAARHSGDSSLLAKHNSCQGYCSQQTSAGNRHHAQWTPQLPTQFLLAHLCGTQNNDLDSFMPDHLVKFWVKIMGFWPDLPVSPGPIYVFFQRKNCKVGGFFARQCLTKQYEMYLIKNSANNKVIIFQHSVRCHMVTKQVGRTVA